MRPTSNKEDDLLTPKMAGKGDVLVIQDTDDGEFLYDINRECARCADYRIENAQAVPGNDLVPGQLSARFNCFVEPEGDDGLIILSSIPCEAFIAKEKFQMGFSTTYWTVDPGDVIIKPNDGSSPYVLRREAFEASNGRKFRLLDMREPLPALSSATDQPALLGPHIL